MPVALAWHKAVQKSFCVPPLYSDAFN